MYIYMEKLVLLCSVLNAFNSILVLGVLSHLGEIVSIMSQVKRALDKLAVHSEPGLTTAQLMLVNDDLKPGTNTPP